MARLVGGFCLPHDPLILGAAGAAPKDKATRVMAAFEQVRQGIEALNADTAIVIGDDHVTMFGTGCMPSILIGIGDLEGPVEPWLGIGRRPVPNHAPLAEHLMNFGFERGFDWAVAKTLALDHSTMVPIHLAVPASVRSIPIYIQCGATPLIRGRRCLQLGRMIGAAVAAWPGDERVVILGTGGISHWVGMADMGRVNEDFDQRILRMVRARDVEGLAALTDEEIVEQAGNGALEVRNWVVAMAALPTYEAEVLAYEPVPEWITGLGFAALKVPA
ncbi:MAG: protocatechuate 3,4-dioxygenase [Burkholderiales bacterium]|nr:protocatechuate 3,4-dioxygenase [Burkholderiales bacterium]